MKDFFENKKIVVVGNARQEKKIGNIIDSHDIVIRMNHGYPRENFYEYVGKKTDVWVCAYLSKGCIEREYKIFNPKYVIRFNGKMQTDKIKIEYPLPKENFDSFKQDYFYKYDNKKPSTGITTIYFLLDYLKINKISITGFDFFQTKNFYEGNGKNTIHRDYHNPKLEKNLIDKYLREKRIELL